MMNYCTNKIDLHVTMTKSGEMYMYKRTLKPPGLLSSHNLQYMRLDGCRCLLGIRDAEP